ncbi:MAG: hypothetical protein WEB09_08205 [Nitriliruptor sp.]
MADETRQQQVTPARARAEAAEGRSKTQLIRIGDREGDGGSRTSPRMRFDILQLAAWTVGVVMVVAGLVALARAGIADIGLFEPVVDIGSQAATPVFAGVWILVGVLVLKAGTGAVGEQRLRIIGVLLAIVGLVLTIEPDAFAEYLGGGADPGTLPLAFGALLIAASFVPPISIARPGIRED